jgi:hypothetical protein
MIVVVAPIFAEKSPTNIRRNSRQCTEQSSSSHLYTQIIRHEVDSNRQLGLSEYHIGIGLLSRPTVPASSP